MKLLILFVIFVVLCNVSVEISARRRRYKNAVAKERTRYRPRENQERSEDDAIIIKVASRPRGREDFETAEDNGTKRKRQQWPGDFQNQQIHYPQFPQHQFPQQQFPQFPQHQFPQPQLPQQQFPQSPIVPWWATTKATTVRPEPPPPTHATVIVPPSSPPPSHNRPSSCGKVLVYVPDTKDDTKIIAGSPTSHGEFPFLAALMIKQGTTQMCGGSLIDDSTILTAAHCFDGATPEKLLDLTVVVGDHNLYHEGEHGVQKRQISKLITHKNWNKRSNYNDIAMLKLASPVEFNQYVQPICLARSAQFYSAGVHATVAGWGRTTPIDGSPLVPQKEPLKITVPLVDNGACQRAFFRASISDHMVCAGEGKKSACLGDSGGPLFKRSDSDGGKFQQIGIVSWGYSCVGLTVYTRVNEFNQWIEKWRDS